MWLVDLKLEQKHGGNDQFDIVKQINPQQMQKKVTKHKVNADVHDHNLGNTNDIHVPHEQLDNRKLSNKIAVSNLWIFIPSFLNNSK